MNLDTNICCEEKDIKTMGIDKKFIFEAINSKSRSILVEQFSLERKTLQKINQRWQKPESAGECGEGDSLCLDRRSQRTFHPYIVQ